MTYDAQLLVQPHKQCSTDLDSGASADMTDASQHIVQHVTDAVIGAEIRRGMIDTVGGTIWMCVTRVCPLVVEHCQCRSG